MRQCAVRAAEPDASWQVQCQPSRPICPSAVGSVSPPHSCSMSLHPVSRGGASPPSAPSSPQYNCSSAASYLGHPIPSRNKAPLLARPHNSRIMRICWSVPLGILLRLMLTARSCTFVCRMSEVGPRCAIRSRVSAQYTLLSGRHLHTTRCGFPNI